MSDEARIFASVARDYEMTEARLTDDPEWQRLTEAARIEERETPDWFFARNRRALYLEARMPPITASPTCHRERENWLATTRRKLLAFF